MQFQVSVCVLMNLLTSLTWQASQSVKYKWCRRYFETFSLPLIFLNIPSVLLNLSTNLHIGKCSEECVWIWLSQKVSVLQASGAYLWNESTVKASVSIEAISFLLLKDITPRELVVEHWSRTSLQEFWQFTTSVKVRKENQFKEETKEKRYVTFLKVKIRC